jgi:hypothetical protein
LNRAANGAFLAAHDGQIDLLGLRETIVAEDGRSYPAGGSTVPDLAVTQWYSSPLAC